MTIKESMNRANWSNYKYSIYELSGYLEARIDHFDDSIEKAIQMCIDTYDCDHSEVIAALRLISDEGKTP